MAIGRQHRRTIATGNLEDAIGRLEHVDATAVPAFDKEVVRDLVDEAAGLPFRPMTATVGEGERVVRQELSVCDETALAGSAFRGLADEIEAAVNTALADAAPAMLDHPLRFNALVLQRYEPGSLGITPHRDHLRYVGLVASLVLSGSGRFFVCDDRSARGAREITAPPGHLILLRAPGFLGRRDRPFHFVADITERRYSLGLRHDARQDPADRAVPRRTRVG